MGKASQYCEAQTVEKASLAALLQKAQTLTYNKYSDALSICKAHSSPNSYRSSALVFFRAALLSISVRARSSPNGEWVASEFFEQSAEYDFVSILGLAVLRGFFKVV